MKIVNKTKKWRKYERNKENEKKNVKLKIINKKTRINKMRMMIHRENNNDKQVKNRWNKTRKKNRKEKTEKGKLKNNQQEDKATAIATNEEPWTRH